MTTTTPSKVFSNPRPYTLRVRYALCDDPDTPSIAYEYEAEFTGGVGEALSYVEKCVRPAEGCVGYQVAVKHDYSDEWEERIAVGVYEEPWCRH